MTQTLLTALPWALVAAITLFTILYIRKRNLMTVELTDDQQAQITDAFNGLKQSLSDAANRVLAAKSQPADIGPVLTAISDAKSLADGIEPAQPPV